MSNVYCWNFNCQTEILKKVRVELIELSISHLIGPFCTGLTLNFDLHWLDAFSIGFVG